MKQEVSGWGKKRPAASTGLGPMLHLTHLMQAHDCLSQTSAAAVSYITTTRIMTPLSPLYRWKPEAPASVARTPASDESDESAVECISICMSVYQVVMIIVNA